AITALSPTAPPPKAAKLSPAPTRKALSTAPAPVCIPQPNGPSMSSGASLETFTTFFSFASAYTPNDDCPKKRSLSGFPSLSDSAWEPSGRAPEKLYKLKFSQLAGAPSWQARQPPQGRKLSTT